MSQSSIINTTMLCICVYIYTYCTWFASHNAQVALEQSSWNIVCQIHSPEGICWIKMIDAPVSMLLQLASLCVVETAPKAQAKTTWWHDHCIDVLVSPQWTGGHAHLVLWVTEAWSQILCFITFLCVWSFCQFFKQSLQSQTWTRFPFIVLTRLFWRLIGLRRRVI